jgi:Amt family ammonium transporter
MPYLQTSNSVLLTLWAFLVPTGLTLLAIGAAREERAQEVATTGLLAIAAAALGYFACGFAFQFGGAAFVSGMPGLQRLMAEWSPLDLSWGPGWGLIGLRGFFLSSEAYNPDAYLLFISHLPWVTTAVLVVLLALRKAVRPTQALVLGLMTSGLIYALFGNWVWGGGWLSNLGLNLELGHGFVDLGGSGAIFLLGGMVVLAIYLLLRPQRPAEGEVPARLPPVHFPLLMVLGTLLAVAGWPALVLCNVLLAEQVAASLVVANALLAAAGGAMVVFLYSWFVTGVPDPLATGRGTVAALVAVSAGCGFIPAWAALLIGALAGVLLLLGLYVSEQVLHLEDPNAALTTFGLPGIWGLLAVAIFADGRWGAGWNGVGVGEYLGVEGQGISGLILAPGYQPAGASQLQAQLVGIGALCLVACILPWAFFRSGMWLRDAAQRAQEQRLTKAAEEAAVEAEPSEENAPAEAAPTDDED